MWYLFELLNLGFHRNGVSYDYFQMRQPPDLHQVAVDG